MAKCTGLLGDACVGVGHVHAHLGRHVAAREHAVRQRLVIADAHAHPARMGGGGAQEAFLEVMFAGQNLFNSSQLEYIAEFITPPTEIERSVYIKVTWNF